MILDFLTKEICVIGEVWDVLRHGVWLDRDKIRNLVTVKGLEFLLSNPTNTEEENEAG